MHHLHMIPCLLLSILFITSPPAYAACLADSANARVLAGKGEAYGPHSSLGSAVARDRGSRQAFANASSSSSAFAGSSSRRRALSPESEAQAEPQRRRMQELESLASRSRLTSRATASKPIPSSWFIQKAYQGQSFFDEWNFATYPDPTHGQVTYVSKQWAQQTNMSYVNSKGQAVMTVDQWSTLAQGQARNSVRIESQDVYNRGLFILDVEQAPWGCGVWPAWWTVGSNWPYNGEIDIIEGVHDNVHNQVALHTGDGCNLTTPSPSIPTLNNYTGITLGTDCFAYANSNSGCPVVDTSQASYGTQFNVLQGGIFAMMWLDDSVRVWFFHRAAIPSDLAAGAPQPNTWGLPMFYSGTAESCNVAQHFNNHQIIFDITFCGDWAGSSYIDSGCPGTCSDRIQDPKNFANASWTINYLHVYGSPEVSTAVNDGSAYSWHPRLVVMTMLAGIATGVLCLI